MKKAHASLFLALVLGAAGQQAAHAQSWADRLLNLGAAANAVGNLRVPGLGQSSKSTSTSPNDPVFGQARVPARAHPQYPNAEWPDRMVEGYIARDRYGCPAFFANGHSMFVYSFDKFEHKVDGAWAELDMMKLAKEVPQHCTGGG